MIARLKRRSALREAVPVRRAPQRRRDRLRPSPEGLRRPPDLRVDRPGALVQMDTMQVELAGTVVYQFAAVDCFTRKRVVVLAPRLTSAQGTAFVRRVVAQFPFPVQAV